MTALTLRDIAEKARGYAEHLGSEEGALAALRILAANLADLASLPDHREAGGLDGRCDSPGPVLGCLCLRCLVETRKAYQIRAERAEREVERLTQHCADAYDAGKDSAADHREAPATPRAVEVVALGKAFAQAYGAAFESGYLSVDHDPDCPQDDACECPGLQALFGAQVAFSRAAGDIPTHDLRAPSTPESGPESGGYRCPACADGICAAREEVARLNAERERLIQGYESRIFAKDQRLSRACEEARAEALAEGWEQAADFLAQVWDDGEQTPQGFDPQQAAEVILMRNEARRLRALSPRASQEEGTL